MVLRWPDFVNTGPDRALFGTIQHAIGTLSHPALASLNTVLELISHEARWRAEGTSVFAMRRAA
jgi:hypothetical protein